MNLNDEVSLLNRYIPFTLPAKIVPSEVFRKVIIEFVLRPLLPSLNSK